MRRSGEGLRAGWTLGVAVLLLLGAGGCKTTSAVGGERLDFSPVAITGDLELAGLNDEELFAKGTAAFGGGDYAQAARYFDRIVDFHPASHHRRAALYNAGLAYERLEDWEQAWHRYSELADPVRGTGDALEASFRSATMLYMLGRMDEAASLLDQLSRRTDLSMTRQLQALVERGVCEKESGDLQKAERTLREVLSRFEAVDDPDEVDDYFPAQAQFHLAEIYRLHYLAVELDPSKGVQQLTKDLDYKSELLLSAQGHYLRCIRLGHGEWATAAGAQVGALYENLWDAMADSPVPPELSSEEGEIYRSELRKKIRVLITKSISVYERTLETAVRIGAQNPYTEQARASLQRMKDLLVAEARRDEEEAAREAAEDAAAPSAPDTQWVPPAPSHGDAAPGSHVG